jgi:hypothetical protein
MCLVDISIPIPILPTQAVECRMSNVEYQAPNKLLTENQGTHGRA